jgi:vacuolar-type H+-ATPase subunit F/Vma7
MIVLATEEFAMGLRLAGVKDSYTVTSALQVKEILKDVPQNKFIIATQSIVTMAPFLEEYQNLITFPDTSHDFSNIDDLKTITRIAIGSEVDI